MTRINIKDLPPKLRAQVLAADEGPTPPPSSTTSNRRTRVPSGEVRGPGPSYRCRTCGTEFVRYGAAAERCADSHGGARLEAILG